MHKIIILDTPVLRRHNNRYEKIIYVSSPYYYYYKMDFPRNQKKIPINVTNERP